MRIPALHNFQFKTAKISIRLIIGLMIVCLHTFAALAQEWAYSPNNYSYSSPYSHAGQSVSNDFNPYDSPPINNYVIETPGYAIAGTGTQPFGNSYVTQNAYGTGNVPPQAVPGGYLSMGPRPVFRQNNAQTLVPRHPSYDHWSDMAEQPWTVQLLPSGLIFPSYLAGLKEPRLGSNMGYDRNFEGVWDSTLGGRVGLLRFGSPSILLPEGIQVDLEGAVLLRMDLMHERNMMANDFRAGVPLTFGGRNWQFKTGYYHVSSHLGDHYMVRTGEMRINYVRDSILLAVARRFWDDWRAYAEAAWAYYTGVETKPWEFQFGVEYSPIYPAHGFRGTPFAAVNLHLFQELNYSGYLCCQLGWQWRGSSNQLFRLGFQYMNGYDDQFQFHDRSTDKISAGFWYDF